MKHICCILISGIIAVTSYAQPNDVEILHYLFPEFTEGVLLLKTGKKCKGLLNYNALTEELIFENKGKILAIGKNEIQLVDTVKIKDRKFVIMNNKFVEIAYHSKWNLYVEHKCKLEEPGNQSAYGGTSQISAITRYSTISDGASFQQLELPEGYRAIPYMVYWFQKNGQIYKLSNLKAFKKLYKDKKDLMKEYLKANPVKYNDKESIIHLLTYLESN